MARLLFTAKTVEIAAEAMKASRGRSSAVRFHVIVPLRIQPTTRTTASTITSSLAKRSFGRTNSSTRLGENESGMTKTAMARIQRATGKAATVGSGWA